MAKAMIHAMVHIAEAMIIDTQRRDLPADRLLELAERQIWFFELKAQDEGLDEFLEQELMPLARASTKSKKELREIEKMVKNRRKSKAEGE